MDDIYKFKKGQLFKIDGEEPIYEVVGWDFYPYIKVVVLAENIKTKEVFSFGYRDIKDAPPFRKIESNSPEIPV